jgi:ribosomal protein S18 acetylase RimI-like enzyme
MIATENQNEGTIVMNPEASARRGVRIEALTPSELREVLEDHARYWGDRDLRSLHLAALVHEFPSTCLLARTDEGISGYIIGFVTPADVGYVHLIATRDDARGAGLGRMLYDAFAHAAYRDGARTLKAITSPSNTGSIAFHRSIGFTARIVDDYNGPGRAMVVFERGIDDMNLDCLTPDRPEIEEVLRAEIETLSRGCRLNADRLDAFLAADFHEFGASGIEVGKDGTAGRVAAYTAEHPQVLVPSAMRGTLIAADVVMVKYALQAGDVRTNRTSLWRRTTSGNWEMFHHQGTIAAPASP